MSKTNTANGSVGSYVAGFLLCLLCTFLSYYMVVNHTVSGDRLLATIVGFAALQVFVQVFFFLHLGRGRKPLYNVAFFIGTLSAIALVIGGSLFIMSHLHYNMVPPVDTAKQLAESEAISQVEGNKTGACQAIKANHKITITAGVAVPAHTAAQLCDTLSFINQDKVAHTITFGTTAKPGSYSGQTTITIRKGMSETITLNQTGTYSFYDQAAQGLIGNFTVTE